MLRQTLRHTRVEEKDAKLLDWSFFFCPITAKDLIFLFQIFKHAFFYLIDRVFLTLWPRAEEGGGAGGEIPAHNRAYQRSPSSQPIFASLTLSPSPEGGNDNNCP